MLSFTAMTPSNTRSQLSAQLSLSPAELTESSYNAAVATR